MRRQEQSGSRHKHPPTTATRRPLRTRFLTWGLVALCAFGAFVTLFDRKDLPPMIRNNVYVAKVYHERDAAIAATGTILERRAEQKEAPADANAEMKQQGYDKQDRAKLDAIITNSGDKTP